MREPSLQERYAPNSTCFGCGPANAKGLRIRSFAREDGTVTAEWGAEPHHEAFPGVLSGGIIGTLLDCHSNWAAAYHLMGRARADHVPATVTAEYAVELLRPAPSDAPVRLEARVIELGDERAVVESSLLSGERVCAKGRGTFVAVRPGHPAYHRWT